MRVRTSTGIRPTDFYGHHYMSNTTDIELASVGLYQTKHFNLMNILIKYIVYCSYFINRLQ